MTNKTHTGYRKSTDGTFTTKQYAISHPKITQKESIPNPGRGDTGRSGKSR